MGRGMVTGRRVVGAGVATALLLVGVGVGCWGCGGKAVEEKYRPAARVERWSNESWARVLSELVTDEGYVRYDRLKSNENGVRDELYRYVGLVGAASPENRGELFPTDADRLAYWINAYNAACLYRVVERGYPEDSSSGLYGMYVFDKTPFGGKSMTLDAVEKQKVRTAGDPRIHFALNCASHSCPPLRGEPFDGAKLDEQLADQGRKYLSDERAVKVVSPGVVEMNSIFTKFYPDDFKEAVAKKSGKGVEQVTLAEALRPYAAEGSPVLTANEIRPSGYDWTINDAKRWGKEN